MSNVTLLPLIATSAFWQVVFLFDAESQTSDTAAWCSTCEFFLLVFYNTYDKLDLNRASLLSY